MSFKDEEDFLLLTPGKKRKFRVLSDESASSASEPEIFMMSSAKKSRHTILSDNEEDRVPISTTKKEQRAEEKQRLREFEKAQNKAIMDSLKKRRQQFDLSTVEEIEAADDPDMDDFIVAEFSDSETEANEIDTTKDGRRFDWLQSVLGVRNLKERAQALVSVLLSVEPLNSPFSAVTPAPALPTHSTADLLEKIDQYGRTGAHLLAASIGETISELSAFRRLAGASKLGLLRSDSFGATPIHYLILNSLVLNPHQLPRVRTEKGNEFFDIVLHLKDSLPLEVYERWLGFLARSTLASDLSIALIKCLVMRDDPLTIKLLLALGASPHACDFEGFPAIHVAALHGRPASLSVLHGLLGNMRATAGESKISPLHAACTGCSLEHLECAKILAPAYAASFDNEGWPALLYALHSGSNAIVSYLLNLDLVSPQPVQFLAALLKSVDPKAALPVRKLLRILAIDPELFPAINAFIERDPRLLDCGPFRFMLKSEGGVSALNLKNKRVYLRRLIESGAGYDGMRITVERENVLGSVLDCLSKTLKDSTDSSHLSFRLPIVRFQTAGCFEEGVAYGPIQEFVSEIDQHLTEAFEVVPSGLFVIPRKGRTFVPDGAAVDYRAIGLLLGLLLIIGQPIRSACEIFPGVWKAILSHSEDELTLDELETFDEELYRSLKKWIAEDNAESDPDENREAVAQSILQSKLNDPAFEDIASGFWSIFQNRDLSFLTPEDLSQILGNSRKAIDVQDWRKNTAYAGILHQGHRIVDWFWKFVEYLAEEERSLLLQFVSGRIGAPSGGFKTLSEQGSKCPFTIRSYADLSTQGLPVASTCFNMLTIPNYSDEGIFREKLLISIRCGSKGFTFT